MRFIAADADAARAKARRALGDGAYIMSVRNLPSGDVEVSASDQPHAETPIGVRPVARTGESPERAHSGARLSEPMEQKFAEDALSRLKGELSGGGRRASHLDPTVRSSQGCVAVLEMHGITGALLGALIEAAGRARIDDDQHRLETAFAEVFSFAPLPLGPGAPIMLIGPTGAGKTSCSAKLAAAGMARDGSALMMTADIGRAGAMDQVRTYSDSLGADFAFVETPLDVKQTLRTRRPGGAVILDTPGVSPYDPGDVAALRTFQEAAAADSALVLPACGDPDEHRDWATAFAEIGVRRMIITKFDATRRVGAALGAAFAGGMSLAFFSESPFISDGLLPATPHYVARRLLASRPGRIA